MLLIINHGAVIWGMDVTSMSDEKLVAHASAGNKQAFGMLVSQYEQATRGTAKRLINDPDSAQECVQDALLEVFLGLDTLRESDRFKSWLCGSV
jgi:RNA polymerase sigma-70 factor (ECF subfamily)